MKIKTKMIRLTKLEDSGVFMEETVRMEEDPQVFGRLRQPGLFVRAGPGQTRLFEKTNLAVHL